MNTTMEPDFMCDALADLADFYAVKPPTVFNVTPGFVPAFIHLRAVQMTDYGFLKALFRVSDTLAPVYVPTVDTARGARHMDYVEGVRKPAPRMTLADKVKAESQAWGLV